MVKQSTHFQRLQHVVVSGGDADENDARVKIWDRRNGVLLTTLRHHDSVVWNVNIWVDTLMTFSHDCTIAIMELNFQVIFTLVEWAVWLWYSWLSCRFQHQKTRVRIQRSEIL